MRYLQSVRLVTLVACWILSAVALGTSGKLNADSKSKFAHSALLYPFIMGLISCVIVYPVIFYSGRPRKTLSRKPYLPAFIEFPLIGCWALVWVGAAHIGTKAWYPMPHNRGQFTWTGCDVSSARGQVDPHNGLDASKYCTTLRTLHGAEWLIPLVTLFTIACMGIPYLSFLRTRGWTETVWLPISEASLTRHTPDDNDRHKQADTA